MPASYVSEFEIICVSPYSSTSSLSTLVSVSNNGLDYGSSDVSFDYADLIEISSIVPRRGSLQGGTIVTISGTGFVSHSIDIENDGDAASPPPLSCTFGGVESTSVTFVSSEEIHCSAPSSFSEGFVTVEVSTNSADYTKSASQFQYLQDLVISSLRPASGPFNGGTKISVFGSNFVDSLNLFCKLTFEDDTAIDVEGRFVSSTQIECESPLVRSTDGGQKSATLKATNNGIDYFGSTSFTFLYTPNAVVKNFVPTFGSSSGETAVTISGSNFVFSSR